MSAGNRISSEQGVALQQALQAINYEKLGQQAFTLCRIAVSTAVTLHCKITGFPKKNGHLTPPLGFIVHKVCLLRQSLLSKSVSRRWLGGGGLRQKYLGLGRQARR